MDRPTERIVMNNHSSHYFVIPLQKEQTHIPSLSSKPSWINVDDEMKIEKQFSMSEEKENPQKNSADFTHFIGIPLNFPSLVDSTTSLKYEILYNVDESLESFLL